MNILYETDQLIIEHAYETTHLRDKSTGEVLLEDEFYGDPTCGLIDDDHQWAIMAGEHLTIWTPRTHKRILDKGLRWVHAMRMRNSETVQILTDPWSKQSAIWEMSMRTLSFKKVRDFDDYRERGYTENIIW